MDIWEYFLQKEREFADAGCIPDQPPSEVFQAKEDSNGRRGRVLATCVLAEGAFVQIYERVVIVNGRPTREAYSYALIIDGLHVKGFERDPAHTDSPVHEHTGKTRKRERNTQPVSLKRALEVVWEEVSLYAEAPFETSEEDD